jgi:hypothetical protein
MSDGFGKDFRLPIIVGIAVIMIMVVAVLPGIQFGINGGNNWNLLSATQYLQDRGYYAWAASGLDAGSIPVATASNTLATDGSGLAYDFGTNTLTAGQIADSGLTSGGVVIAGASGQLGTDTDFTFSGDTATITNLDSPTGRSSTYVIAASNAPAYVKAQADFICNGTADNVEIQAAIDAITTAGCGGNVLLFGLFNISSTINIDSNGITLEGVNPYGSSGATSFSGLKLANNSNCNMIYITGYKGCVRYLNLDGNLANNASGKGIVTAATQALDAHIEWVYLFYCKNNAIYWESGNGSAQHVYCEYSGGYDWYINGSRNTFTDCSSWAPGNTSFYVAAGADKNIFTACRSSLTAGDGFYVDGGQNVITSCQLWDVGLNGFNLVNTNSNIISNNFIYKASTTTPNTYAGIKIGDTADGLMGLADVIQIAEDCEDVWNITAPAGGATKATVAVNTAYVERGTNCLAITAAASIANADILAWETTSTAAQDLSTATYLQFKFRSTVALNAGDLSIALDQAADFGTPIEWITLPAITANTTTLVVLLIPTPGAGYNSVDSVGIRVNDVTRFASTKIAYIDDIRAILVDTTIFQAIPIDTAGIYDSNNVTDAGTGVAKPVHVGVKNVTDSATEHDTIVMVSATEATTGIVGTAYFTGTGE